MMFPISYHPRTVLSFFTASYKGRPSDYRFVSLVGRVSSLVLLQLQRNICILKRWRQKIAGTKIRLVVRYAGPVQFPSAVTMKSYYYPTALKPTTPTFPLPSTQIKYPNLSKRTMRISTSPKSKPSKIKAVLVKAMQRVQGLRTKRLMPRECSRWEK